MRILTTLVALTSLLISSQIVFAQQSLDDADTAFAERENNRKEIQKALGLYNKALREATNLDDKIYAVEQIGRLANYENSILPSGRSEKKYKIKLFKNCLDAADLIGPKKIKEKLVSHYYVKALCLAQWARANGITTSLSRTKELIGYITVGRKMDASYEGGGFDRLLAAIYINLPPINPFGPARDYKKSLSHSTSAIKSAAYEGAFNPEFETGVYYFNAYGYQATALAKTGKKAKAIATLKSVIARIEKGDINEDRKPETLVDLKSLKEQLADLK